MSGALPRGVPWINWDEWLRVMDGLFSNSTDSDCDIQQSTALQTVSGELNELVVLEPMEPHMA